MSYFVIPELPATTEEVKLMDSIRFIFYLNEYEDSFKILGRGSFGEVHLVTRRSDGQQFALKLMNKNKVKSQDILAEYNLRLVFGDSCKHGLVCYHDLFVTEAILGDVGGHFYGLVMDYIQGEDLTDVINKRALTYNHKKKITEDLIITLKLIHSFNLVHRDIKPNNINCLYDEDYTKTKITILDYGFVCAIAELPHFTNMCNDKVVGTKDYIDLNILIKANDKEKITHQDWINNDIWALGITLWVLWVKGKFIKKLPVPSITRYLRHYDKISDIDPETEAKIMSMLNVDPLKRIL